MVTFFAVGMTFFAVPPLVDTLRGSFSLSNLAIGLLMGAIAVPAIVLSIPFGVAIDRWPPRAAGLAGLAAMLAGSVVFAAAPGYGWLLTGRLVFGAGALLLNLLLARLISVAFAGRELALAMGLFTGAYPAAMIVLFSLHPWLHAHLGWRAEMGLLAALVLVAIPLHAVAVPRSLPAGEETQRPAGAGALPAPLFALGLSWMLYFVGFAAVTTFGPEWAGGGAGGLMTTSVITWVAMFGTPLSGAVIDRSGRPQVWCAAGVGLMAVTLALMAARSLPAVAAMAALGVVASITPPAIYSLPGRLVPVGRVGFAFGFITALSNLGTVLGPALAGVTAVHRASAPSAYSRTHESNRANAAENVTKLARARIAATKCPFGLAGGWKKSPTIAPTWLAIVGQNQMRPDTAVAAKAAKPSRVITLMGRVARSAMTRRSLRRAARQIVAGSGKGSSAGASAAARKTFTTSTASAQLRHPLRWLRSSSGQEPVASAARTAGSRSHCVDFIASPLVCPSAQGPSRVSAAPGAPWP